jgi:cytochrome c oxidase subunit 3
MANQPPPTLFNASPHPLPAGTGTIGMLLFLAALVMLFAGSMVAYLIVRLTAADAPPMGSIDLPWGLWVSTVVILLSSFTIHRALVSVRRERQSQFRTAMLATLLLAILFLLFQTPSLLAIVHEHLPKLREYQAAREEMLAHRGGPVGVEMPLEGLVFLLIFVHALHVIGGVIPLAVITWFAHAGRYDHEQYSPIKHMAMYWHFLDGVWIFMFAVLLIAA